MQQDKSSNYARKRDYLKAQNRRAAGEVVDGDQPNGRVFGFHFPIGKKPWVKKK